MDQIDIIETWLKHHTFQNCVGIEKMTGKCFIVHRPTEEVYLSDIEKTFTWCSEHTTAAWTKVIVGVFIFTSKDDASHFKMVWG